MRRTPRGAITRCDACGTAFTPAPVEEPRAGGGVILQFSCPSCGAIYPVAAITGQGLTMRARLQQMARMGQAGKPPYRHLMARYERQVTRLSPPAQPAQPSTQAEQPGAASGS